MLLQRLGHFLFFIASVTYIYICVTYITVTVTGLPDVKWTVFYLCEKLSAYNGSVGLIVVTNVGWLKWVTDDCCMSVQLQTEQGYLRASGQGGSAL